MAHPLHLRQASSAPMTLFHRECSDRTRVSTLAHSLRPSRIAWPPSRYLTTFATPHRRRGSAEVHPRAGGCPMGGETDDR